MLHQPFSGTPETIPEAGPEDSSGSSVQSLDNNMSRIVVGGEGVATHNNNISTSEQSGSPFDTPINEYTTLNSVISPPSSKTSSPPPPSPPAAATTNDGSSKRSTGPTHINMSQLSEEQRDRLLSLIPRDPETGKQLSAGSIVHELGTCRPCVFANNTERPCVFGVECLFCHYHHDIRKRSRMSRKQRVEARKMRETQNSIGCTLGSPVLGDGASAEEIFQCLVGHAHAVELQKVTLDHLLDSPSDMPPPFCTPSHTTSQYNNDMH